MVLTEESGRSSVLQKSSAVGLPANLDSQGLFFWYTCESQEGLVRSAILDSAIRPMIMHSLRQKSFTESPSVGASNSAADAMHKWL